MDSILNKYNLFRYISYYFDEDNFKCCICVKKVDFFYLICKPNCVNNSYCRECIVKIEKENKRCPFTNTVFTYEDISIDYKKNKSLESFKEIHKKLFDKKISINIDIN